MDPNKQTDGAAFDEMVQGLFDPGAPPEEDEPEDEEEAEEDAEEEEK